MNKINYKGRANQDTYFCELNLMNTSEIYFKVLNKFKNVCTWKKLTPEDKGYKAFILRCIIKGFLSPGIKIIIWKTIVYFGKKVLKEKRKLE